MQLAARTTTAGFTTTALLKIKGARGQGIPALEVAQNTAGGLMSPPERLAEFGQIFGHLHALYSPTCRLQV